MDRDVHTSQGVFDFDVQRNQHYSHYIANSTADERVTTIETVTSDSKSCNTIDYI